MAASTQEDVAKKLLNVPNQLTTARLILSLVLFGFIVSQFYLISLVLFVIAAGTDWLDGYLARKYNQVTTLGRILDPFADKIIICGTFILLAASPAFVKSSLVKADLVWGLPILGLQAWMVVIVVGRELLVTVLRSFLEKEGHDFSAKMSGKVKMVFQCITAGVALYCLYRLQLFEADKADNLTKLIESPTTWLFWLLEISIVLTVLTTLYSGAVYIFAAARLLRDESESR